MPIVCAECGGLNIQARAWVNPNTNEVIDWEEAGFQSDHYCDDCDEHTEFKYPYEDQGETK